MGFWDDITLDLQLEHQIYGGTMAGSGFSNVGEAYNQLALFNYVEPQTVGGSVSYWLRDIFPELR